jgi:hypothetical protein
MVTVHIERFKIITGVSLEHFTQNILKGDSWGIFLKIASVIESSSKRAIALKKGLDPDSPASIKVKFSVSLIKCSELSLITKEAFNFADNIRKVRNDLVHKGNLLNLNIETMNGKEFNEHYIKMVNDFVSIQGFDISKNEKQHFDTLVMALIIFTGLISKELYQDNWLQHLETKS